MKPDLKEIREQLAPILAEYDAAAPTVTADRLRDLWLQFEPKSVAGIKENLRVQQETVGIPVPVLKAMGKEMAKVARNHVDAYIPLMRLLWESYGREGRVVAVKPWGAMELVSPEKILPLLKVLCRTCITWEDADHLAMEALEPIVRKQPDVWLAALEPWLADENKWVRRTGVTVVARLPMKRSAYTDQCLELAGILLPDDDVDVKKAVSFAIRLAARGDPVAVRHFLAKHVPPQDSAATWVLCDAIRKMTKRFLPDFTELLPLYEAWAESPSLESRERRSVESALKVLRKAQRVD